MTKHCVKMFLRPWDIIPVVGRLAKLILSWERMITPQFHAGIKEGTKPKRKCEKKTAVGLISVQVA